MAKAKDRWARPNPPLPPNAAVAPDGAHGAALLRPRRARGGRRGRETGILSTEPAPRSPFRRPTLSPGLALHGPHTQRRQGRPRLQEKPSSSR